jgi:hypothetical protein
MNMNDLHVVTLPSAVGRLKIRTGDSDRTDRPSARFKTGSVGRRAVQIALTKGSVEPDVTAR